MSHTTLISAQELQTLMGAARPLLLLDVNFDLADTAAGYGCTANLPPGAVGFTTIELKSNHLGTAREGLITCIARATHAGRTTQVWDAEVIHADTGKTIALFRCTQMILYPR